MNEIAEATGLSKKRLTGMLWRLKHQGRLDKTEKVVEVLDGRMMPVPAYRLK